MKIRMANFFRLPRRSKSLFLISGLLLCTVIIRKAVFQTDTQGEKLFNITQMTTKVVHKPKSEMGHMHKRRTLEKIIFKHKLMVRNGWIVPQTEAAYEQYIHQVCDLELKNRDHTEITEPLCPCFPFNDFAGNSVITESELVEAENIPWSDLNEILSNLEMGGMFHPKNCTARRKVAVIVPYRDRESHLKLFLLYNVPQWQRQQTEFRIFVIEQGLPSIFNKGSVMNAGFLEVKNLYDFDCVLFHDVDMLSENDRNMVVCGDMIVHHGAYVNKFNYSLPYFDVFGGAVSLTPEQFTALNGYSNEYPGWGGEDDNFFHRSISKGFHRFRGPKSVARYHMKKHFRDGGNPILQTRKNLGHISHVDGLNSVKWKLTNIKVMPHYTLIQIDLIENPE